MARDLKFGIRITADGKVLVAEAGRAGQAIGSIGKTVEDANRHTGALTASFARMGHVAAAAFGTGDARAASSTSMMNMMFGYTGWEAVVSKGTVRGGSPSL